MNNARLLSALLSVSCLLGCGQQQKRRPNTYAPIYLGISKRAADMVDSVVRDRRIANAFVFDAGTDSITGMPKIGITLAVMRGTDTISTDLVQNSNRFLRLKKQTVPVTFPMEDYLYDNKDHFIQERNYNVIVLYISTNRELLGVEDWDKSMNEK